MENTEIMTVTEVASFLKLSKATIYGYVKAGKIPVTRIGFKQRFSKRLVLQAMEAGFPLPLKAKTKK